MRGKLVLAMLLAMSAPARGHAAGEAVGFESPRWAVADGQRDEYLERKALAGTALLEGASMRNGTIEVDVVVTGARSYPGIVFRRAGTGEYERVYLRPHRSGLYADVVQYVPAFHGVDSWQLYSGPGFTAPAIIPTGQWVHLKLEVAGTQARLFIGEARQPALTIRELKHAPREGGLGVMAPADGSAHFSNFRYTPDDTLRIDAPPPAGPVPGVVRNWELSATAPADLVDMERYPKSGARGWTRVTADANGLVDVSRHRARREDQIECVFARTYLDARKAETRKLRFGYSDEVSVFLNGTLLFRGDSAYRSRDSSFLGVVGLFDALYLPLKPGRNELLLIVKETMGGWGFMCQSGDAVELAPGVREAWRTDKCIAVPESVAYDAARKRFYIGEYGGPGETQRICMFGLDGTHKPQEWLRGVHNPTGLAVRGDTLYIVEPNALVTADIPSAKIVKRVPVEGSMMLNDVTVTADGVAYVSDSFRSAIWRVSDGKADVWLSGPECVRPNGVCVDGQRLLVLTNGDGALRSVDLASKATRVLAKFPPGLLDGLQVTKNGTILVSHNEGRLYAVAPDGNVTRLVDTSVVGRNIADFVYVPGLRLLVCPGWTSNGVAAYTLGVGR